MGKKASYLPIVVLCTALFTGYGAKAQDVLKPENEPVPAKVRGYWSLPDCGSYDEALMISRHFYLKADMKGSRFWPIGVTGKEKTYNILTVEGKNRPVQVQEDGVLKIGKLAEKAPAAWPKTWDDLMLDGTREYMNCAEIPALLPDPLVRVMVHIDKIEAECSDALTEKCRHLLFTIVDDDKNKKISLKEMKMAGAMLTGMATLVENHTADRNTLDKGFYESFRETDRVFKALSPDGKELKEKDFEGFAKKAGSASLNAALAETGKLFAALSPAPPPPAADGR